MASIGEGVSVNLEGMTVGGVPCGAGSWASGTVLAVDDSGFTVQLDSPLSSGAGTAQDTVVVAAERIDAK